MNAFYEPVLDIMFYRPRLRVEGFVKFLNETTSKERSDTLVSISSGNKKLTQNAKNEEKGSYNFGNILPGFYTLSINNDNLCWDKNELPVEINKFSNITEKNFEQIGFKLRYKVPKEITVRIVDPSGEKSDLKLNENENTICVQKAGIYKLSPDNCYLFNNSNFVYDTRLNQTLIFDPIKLLVKGTIKLNQSILKSNNFTNASLLGEYIMLSLDINSNDGTSENVNVSVKFEKNEKNQISYSYFYYAKPHSIITITPSIRKNLKNNVLNEHNFLQNLLFYPERIQLDVKEQCIKHTPTTDFEVRPGLIFQGNITPQIDDLLISIYIVSDEGEDQLMTSITTSDASLKLGPYIDSNKVIKLYYLFY